MATKNDLIEAQSFSRRRLLTAFVSGAPGLDGLVELAALGRDELCSGAGFDPAAPLGLMVYHPVLQEAASAGLVTQKALVEDFPEAARNALDASLRATGGEGRSVCAATRVSDAIIVRANAPKFA